MAILLRPFPLDTCQPCCLLTIPNIYNGRIGYSETDLGIKLYFPGSIDSEMVSKLLKLIDNLNTQSLFIISFGDTCGHIGTTRYYKARNLIFDTKTIILTYYEKIDI